MRCTSSFVAAGLVAFTSAESQTPAQTTQPSANNIQPYLYGMATDSAFVSAFSSIATDAAALYQLHDFQVSIASDLQAGNSINTAAFTALPTALASLVMSVYTAGASIAIPSTSASVPGTTGSNSSVVATKSASAGAAQATTNAATGNTGGLVLANAGLVAGLFGVVMAF